jgi:hypothetical protein
LTEFSIIAGFDGLKVRLEEVWGFPNKTSYAGGYDTQSSIEIWCGGFRAAGILYISTGEVYRFFEGLQIAFKSLTGSAQLKTIEGQLELQLGFEEWGHFRIKGYYREKIGSETVLHFEMLADQTYLQTTLQDLEKIYEKYGDNMGK